MAGATTFGPEDVAALAEQLRVTNEVDLSQLRIGMEVELEHGRRDSLTNVTDDDPLMTAKIALAHLRELPDYYSLRSPPPHHHAGGTPSQVRLLRKCG